MAHVVEVDLIVGGFVVTKMHIGYIGFRCCWQVLVDRRIWAKRKGCEAFASQPFLSHMDIVVLIYGYFFYCSHVYMFSM
jgi:hypothetical protein